MTRLVATKLLAPALPTVLVRRRHLYSNLSPQPGRRVSLVVGPPGAGKTTLVREWLAALPAETRWGWLSLDPDDSEPGRLAAALVAAVRSADATLGRDAGDLLADADPDPPAVVAALVDAIALEASSPVIVVLDDAHVVAHPDAWRHVAWLVDHQPAQLHLVLTARSDPPLPLGRWRARGQLGEVRTAALSFSLDESHELLSQAVGLQATAAFSASLHERTEGWAAGVRLASLALESGASTDDVVARFSGSDSTVAELLVEEVLDRQPPDIRRFLLDTSILTTLEPALCQALSGRADAALLLRRLAADHLFIRPLDGQRDRYRHHALFAELLRAELRVEDPSAEAEQHERAARWYQETGVIGPAITHALAAGDHDRVVTLIADHREELHAEGHGRAMGRWLAAVPDRFITADPARAVDHATTLLLLARPEANRWLRTALPLIPADAYELQARALRLDAVLNAAVGRLEAFEQLMNEADAVAAGHAVVDSMVERALAWRPRLLSLVGRHDEAIAHAERLLATRRRFLRDDVATSVLAGVLADAGYHERAGIVADRALERWEADGSPALFGMVDALRARAAVDRLAGEYVAAHEHVERAQLLLEGQTAHVVNALVVIEAAALDVATGRAADAVHRLDRLDIDGRIIGAHQRLLDKVAAARQLAAETTSTPLPAPRPPAVLPGGQHLTERELVVLRYLASHLTLPELASELLVSHNTIKSQVAAVYRKLGATSRSEAVELGRERGLVASGR